jgi:hypothetical protein
VALGGFSLLLLLFYAMGVGMVARIAWVLGWAMANKANVAS